MFVTLLLDIFIILIKKILVIVLSLNVTKYLIVKNWKNSEIQYDFMWNCLEVRTFNRFFLKQSFTSLMISH